MASLFEIPQVGILTSEQIFPYILLAVSIQIPLRQTAAFGLIPIKDKASTLKLWKQSITVLIHSN